MSEAPTRPDAEGALEIAKESWDEIMDDLIADVRDGALPDALRRADALIRIDEGIRRRVSQSLSAGPASPGPMAEMERPTSVAASEVLARAETDERLKCFLLGARIHDHVDDMVWAVQEIAEAKPGDDTGLGADATRILDTLRVTTGGEINKAIADGCVGTDDAVTRQWRVVLDAGVTQGFSEFGDAVRALAATLGDPPLLRNVRRYVETRPSRPEERK